jgi:hypothetical protein
MGNGHRRLSWWGLLLAAAVFAIGGFAAGCGDDDDDGEDGDGGNTPAAATSPTAAASPEEAEMQAAYESALAAWNAKDVATLVTHFTENGLLTIFGSGAPDETVEAVTQGLNDFIGEPPLSDVEFLETSVAEGDATGTLEVTRTAGAVLEHFDTAMVNEGSTWKIDGEERLPVDVPADAANVPVDMNEFAFAVNTDDIVSADGTIALELNNVGQQQHHIVLVTIPADANIDELIQAEDTPPGVEDVASTAPIDPGAEMAVVFAQPLEPGRYLMACFLPDTDEGPEGTPHALKGMLTEFTIDGSNPAAGISPAATP